MKKSGNTPVRLPPEARYRWNALPARNSAGRGIGSIATPASCSTTSSNTMVANRTDNPA
jgi:hypothetical protein